MTLIMNRCALELVEIYCRHRLYKWSTERLAFKNFIV